MQKLLKGLILFMLIINVALAMTGVANAENFFSEACGSGEAQQSTFCKNIDAEGGKPLGTGKDSILMRISQTVIYLTAAISVVVVIIGGFRYVLSGGDSNGVAAAKKTIIYALVGLLVAVSAQMIVTLVISKLV